MGTILEDKEHRDLHVVAGLITLIKVHGLDWCKHAIDDLSGYVAANDILTPKQKCEAAHSGQCGECSESGVWTPCA